MGGFVVSGPTTISEIAARVGAGEYRVSACGLDAGRFFELLPGDEIDIGGLTAEKSSTGRRHARVGGVKISDDEVGMFLGGVLAVHDPQIVGWRS